MFQCSVCFAYFNADDRADCRHLDLSDGAHICEIGVGIVYATCGSMPGAQSEYAYLHFHPAEHGMAPFFWLFTFYVGLDTQFSSLLHSQRELCGKILIFCFTEMKVHRQPPLLGLP